ncbi:MAG: LexA family transcriptional regulator [Bacteroidetes bacterium]|jgi:transcriptional regulator with XRE-family HTH domain|nr:LexA family transcriptional regulator [Bacteroidota bacterium]MBT5528998.1 LexA family transcriptional regulator [Cytophagia bacterium]MBT3802955.1 LexA family transcriptional regulator [Bacteroidota bacterium]MBT3935980.1 LexA family transcriptional regulator [Bacteroidota bacterium]MBT4339535.1 LexA family transcriptional regulator [Bacteroidota bacterium]
MLNHFNANIKLLRKRLRITQEDVANELNMKRSTLSGLENNVSQPTITALLTFSNFYKVSIDTLLKIELSKLTGGQLSEVINGNDLYLRGSTLRILTTTVNQEDVENIELIPEKAKAGYATGFADPEYIKRLPTFQLPFLSKDRKYRSFQISGDSMFPIPEGAYVTGEYVDNWYLIRNRQAYIILTLDDGIVFKVAENLIEKENKLTLYSLNPLYEPYDIHVSEIKEVWKFVNYISSDMPEAELPQNEMLKTIATIKHDVNELKKKFYTD